MIPELRRQYNRDFTPAKYQHFLSLLNERCGTHVKFRVCETPCFFPAPLIESMQQAGTELIHQLVQNEAYLKAARRQIPSGFVAPNETARPLFVQADFGLVRDAAGEIVPKLVEIQGFPSLYAHQPVVEDTYREAFGLARIGSTAPDAVRLLRRAILGGHAPENVVLLEINPYQQKTLCDFLLTAQACGIRIADVRKVRRQGRKLYLDGIPIDRIYNRAIADELIRLDAHAEFRFDEELEVEWAGHPNWFFLISKFSLPWLKHASVPESRFLDELFREGNGPIPHDLENYVLKPLYSFAGLGVKVGPSREDIDAIPREERSHYLLQKRMRFEPVIETPFGPTQAEVRVMYIWLDQLTPVSLIVRMGRGKMMGVDHNRDMEWVGASAAFRG